MYSTEELEARRSALEAAARAAPYCPSPPLPQPPPPSQEPLSRDELIRQHAVKSAEFRRREQLRGALERLALDDAWVELGLAASDDREKLSEGIASYLERQSRLASYRSDRNYTSALIVKRAWIDEGAHATTVCTDGLDTSGAYGRG